MKGTCPCIIIFETPKWTKLNAVLWLYNHDYLYNNIDESNPYFLRFIQYSCNKIFINKKMDNGIEFVFSD